MNVRAYITIDGTPFCQHPAAMRHHPETCTLFCGHLSLASAHRAKREIQKHWHTVRVIRGDCPNGPKSEDLS